MDYREGASAEAALETLKAHIRENCIVRWSESEPICAPDGKKFSWMFDLRPLLLDGRMLQMLAALFWDTMGIFWPFQLAGIEVAAVPLMAGIVIEGNRRGFPITALIVRQKRKKYGRFRVVEGDPKPGIPVILVDDAINSGRSINKAMVAIQNLGLQTEHVFTIAHFHSETALDWCRMNRLTIHHLVTPQDFQLSFKGGVRYKTHFHVIWKFTSLRANYRFAVAKSTPVLYKENLLFGSDSGIFRSVDKRDGMTRWWYITTDKTGKGIVSSPIVVDGQVYFGGYCGGLFCLDAESGREIWKVKPCDWIGSSPCYANGHIYVGLEFQASETGGALAKFCARTGGIKWQVYTKRMLHGSPVYSEKHNAIVLGTNDSTVLVIDADTGAVRRTLQVGGPVKYHCALSDDLAVFGSFDGKIYVWDFIKDEVKMTIQTDDIVYSRALIIQKRAFMGSADHGFYVIDLERFCEIRRIDAKEKVHSSPALIGDTVFFGTSGGELLGIDPNSLDVTHRFQFPERLTNTIVSDGVMMFIYAYDNTMWAIA